VRPYADLLKLIPELSVQVVGEDACCGMGGSVGFKADVHEASLEVGRPLFESLEKLAPDAIVTDCLSCRLQFNHALQYPVFHPMEILARAYGEGESSPTSARQS
jgi:glycerol-3-phosphate dehydrogenase subunit C